MGYFTAEQLKAQALETIELGQLDRLKTLLGPVPFIAKRCHESLRKRNFLISQIYQGEALLFAVEHLLTRLDEWQSLPFEIAKKHISDIFETTLKQRLYLLFKFEEESKENVQAKKEHWLSAFTKEQNNNQGDENEQQDIEVDAWLEKAFPYPSLSWFSEASVLSALQKNYLGNIHKTRFQKLNDAIVSTTSLEECITILNKYKENLQNATTQDIPPSSTTLTKLPPKSLNELKTEKKKIDQDLRQEIGAAILAQLTQGHVWINNVTGQKETTPQNFEQALLNPLNQKNLAQQNTNLVASSGEEHLLATAESVNSREFNIIEQQAGIEDKVYFRLKGYALWATTLTPCANNPLEKNAVMDYLQIYADPMSENHPLSTIINKQLSRQSLQPILVKINIHVKSEEEERIESIVQSHIGLIGQEQNQWRFTWLNAHLFENVKFPEEGLLELKGHELTDAHYEEITWKRAHSIDSRQLKVIFKDIFEHKPSPLRNPLLGLLGEEGVSWGKGKNKELENFSLSEKMKDHLPTLTLISDFSSEIFSAQININSQDQEGRSLLTHAVFKGEVEMVTFLLGGNADMDLPDVHGKTPTDYVLETDDPFLMRPFCLQRDKLIEWTLLPYIDNFTRYAQEITTSPYAQEIELASEKWLDAHENKRRQEQREKEKLEKAAREKQQKEESLENLEQQPFQKKKEDKYTEDNVPQNEYVHPPRKQRLSDRDSKIVEDFLKDPTSVLQEGKMVSEMRALLISALKARLQGDDGMLKENLNKFLGNLTEEAKKISSSHELNPQQHAVQILISSKEKAEKDPTHTRQGLQLLRTQDLLVMAEKAKNRELEEKLKKQETLITLLKNELKENNKTIDAQNLKINIIEEERQKDKEERQKDKEEINILKEERQKDKEESQKDKEKIQKHQEEIQFLKKKVEEQDENFKLEIEVRKTENQWRKEKNRRHRFMMPPDPCPSNWAPNYHAVLDVSLDASAEEIEKAYQTLAKIWDPAENEEWGDTQQWQWIKQSYRAVVLAKEHKPEQLAPPPLTSPTVEYTN